jgi:hypothetical protein
MDKIIFISVIIILILLIKCYFDREKFNNISLNPAESKLLSEEIIKINKEKYQKYIKEKEELLKDTEYKIGYSILDNTDENTLGLCPLGKYFDGKYEGNTEDVFTKCKKCFECNKFPGYYYKEGCIGDKDSVCEFKKLPHDLYMKAHTYPYTLHSQIPQHQHGYLNDDDTKLLTSKEHKHLL